jgi:hypothetical protein
MKIVRGCNEVVYKHTSRLANWQMVKAAGKIVESFLVGGDINLQLTFTDRVAPSSLDLKLFGGSKEGQKAESGLRSSPPFPMTWLVRARFLFWEPLHFR